MPLASRKPLVVLVSFFLLVMPARAETGDHFLVSAEKLNDDIRLQSLASKAQSTELAKIQYLLALIGNSPYTFIRNGQEHNGREASAHLRWKYGHAFGRIKTAEEFINHIASGSLASGKPYEVKFADGSVMRMKEVLVAESHRLESFDDMPA